MNNFCSPDPIDLSAPAVSLDPLGSWSGLADNVQDALEELEGSVTVGSYKVKISSNDTTGGFLNGKLVAGTGITLTENNNGGDETLSVICGITQYTDALARASISETITGIDYNSTTGVFSITTGYVIPTTTEESNWNTAYGWGNHASGGYLKADGTIALTADWDAGGYEIRALTFESDVATGTAPLVIASTTKVANLNADLLDDQTGSYYLDSANFTGTNWTDLTDSGATTLHKHDHGGMDGLGDDDHTQYTRKSILTAKGDLYAATASATPAKQAVGTNGQALIADSAQATGMKWGDVASFDLTPHFLLGGM